MRVWLPSTCSLTNRSKVDLAERPGIFLDADAKILPGFDPSSFEAAGLTKYGNTKTEEGGHANNFDLENRPPRG